MKVLVTGGNGFIGSHLVEELLKGGSEVHCLVKKTSDLRFLNSMKVTLIYGDLDQKDLLGKAVAEKDYIYHLSGVKRARRSETYYQVNHLGTQSLVEACARYNPQVKKILFVSSLAACGPSPDGHCIKEEEKCLPITEYGKSKFLGEQAILEWRDTIPVVIVRPPVVYGPRDRDLLSYFRWINRGISIFIGEGKSIVSLCYVKDLISGILMAGEHSNSSGQIYFIADDQVYSWSTVAKCIVHSIGKQGLNIHLSKTIISFLSLLMEGISFFTGKPVILNREKILEASQPYWVCDVSKAKNELGFTPAFTLEDGIKTTVRWYRKEGWL
ncbi:MAG: hypothetical protein AMJ42_02865 [Deltaproteobacteria bacterium DG_8]|nr:MAG: hypothetical protein AMJ42_02865 [Deltaproteobacteria bacterium DG_8]